MLYIRQLEQADLESAATLIKKAFEGNANQACYDFIPANTMIFLDGQLPVGLCSYKTPMEDVSSRLLEGTAFIDLVYLTEAGKNFSYTDGLLRAMLNLLEKRGINRVYVGACSSEDETIGVTASRLAKVGLDLLDDSDETETILDNYRAYNYGATKKLFKADLAEFFGRPCRSEQNAKAYS